MSEEDPIITLEKADIYQEDHLVLRNVNLRMKKGEFLYLVGRTGSGKSTLLKTLYGELPLGGGEGRVAGYDLNRLKKKEIPYLRRKLGIVFQDFQLLTDRSVNENIRFVMKATGWKDKKKMEKRKEHVLDRVGLGTKGFKMPHELSGGEQQRVVIARSLINDPVLILADEPTGNLDPETTKGIVELLFEISGSGRGVLMASHDFHIMKDFPSRTIKCEDSTVVESGPKTP